MSLQGTSTFRDPCTRDGLPSARVFGLHTHKGRFWKKRTKILCFTLKLGSTILISLAQSLRSLLTGTGGPTRTPIESLHNCNRADATY